jgi:glycosyltransferase involved in cell wall biosynthesis
MKISVIVPFLNASQHLGNCLQALVGQQVQDLEIILVDNGSIDCSADIAQEFISNHPESRIILLEEKTPGASAARNSGARKAQGVWLIFTDADCVPDSEWVSDFKKEINKNDSVGALAGCIRPAQSDRIVSRFLGMFTLPGNETDSLHSGTTLMEGLFPSANLAVRRDIFNLIGGFTESLRFGEDHDLCYKIYKSGYKIKAITNAVVRHIHRTTLIGLAKQSFGFGTAHPYELRHFTSGAIILSSPLIQVNRPCKGIYIWIDMNQADKKLLISLIPGLFWSPLYILSIIYFSYLCFFINKVGVQKNVSIKIWELPALSTLLIMKSVALTVGRLVYSFKHKVLCV